ncbi:MAG TPA: PAS domain S-box protein [Lacunisphaera sp.]|nr:PAS domain S-box protein [Lacunisphaera sp.]
MITLLIAVDPRDVESISSTLSAEWPDSRIAAAEPSGLAAALDRVRPDLILADLRAGTDALKVARQRIPDVPFIYLAGEADADQALAAIRSGADACVPRGQALALRLAALRAVRHHAARREREEPLALFRRLVDSSNDAFEVIDPDSARFLDISEKECANLGYRREEFLQLRVFDIDPTVTPEGWPKLMQTIRAASFHRHDGIHRRRDGTTFPVEVNVRLVRHGREYLVVVARDITERRKVEARVRLQAAALRSAANAIVITDQTGGIEWVNPAFTQLTGYTPEEAIGCNPRELVKSGQQDDAFYARMWETICAGQVWKGEMINRRRDGSLYHESQTITPVRGEHGQITHFIAIKEDISERKRTDARNREQAEVIDKSPMAILITDLSNRITYCNEGARRLYRRKTEGLLGRTAEDLFAGETLRCLQAGRAATFATGTWRGEVPLQFPDGSRIDAEFFMYHICDEAGHPKARLSIALDITDKKALEAKLLHAQRLENLGMLAAGIVHDLNNVLAPVMMAGALLRQTATGDREKRMLDVLDSSATRGAKLLRQILAFSRHSAGERGAVQLKHLVREIESLVQETFPKSITCETWVSPDLPPVNANPTQLHQVLLNLCVNARDAMPDGGRLAIDVDKRKLEAQRRPPHLLGRNPDFVSIAVSDSGTGMSPEVLEKIWDPFFTTKAPGKGTGLGLSTVRGIVNEHGGFLTVDSKVGAGTTFRLYLPAITETVDSVTPVGIPQDVPAGNGRRVLVVDDDEAVRNMLGNVLSQHGYAPLFAAHGVEALTYLNTHADAVDAVITDIHMPHMNGDVLVRVLRGQNPSLKVLIITGHPSDNPNRQSGPALEQPDPVLFKPFRPADLLRALGQLLQGPS